MQRLWTIIGVTDVRRSFAARLDSGIGRTWGGGRCCDGSSNSGRQQEPVRRGGPSQTLGSQEPPGNTTLAHPRRPKGRFGRPGLSVAVSSLRAQGGCARPPPAGAPPPAYSRSSSR